MKTNAVIFDFGGVLIEWDPRNLYRSHFKGEEQAMENFLAEVRFMEWNAEQDKGRPFAEGVKALSTEFPQHADLIRAFHENWIQSIGGVIEDSVKLVRKLKEKGIPVYGLSNWSMETFPLVREKFDFLHLFDGVILSGEVKLVKPDPAIFELCLQMMGRSAKECLFIDDSEPNIRTAKNMGFDIIHFKSAAGVEAGLRERGLLGDQ